MTSIRLATVCLFLGTCGTAHAQDYQRAWRYIDLRKLPADQRLQEGTAVAQQLQQILDRDVQFDLAALSKDPEGRPPGTDRERVDRFSVDGKTLELQLERVTVRSGAKVWLFSSGSVDAIRRI